jgi:hypothetical protein
VNRNEQEANALTFAISTLVNWQNGRLLEGVTGLVATLEQAIPVLGRSFSLGGLRTSQNPGEVPHPQFLKCHSI